MKETHQNIIYQIHFRKNYSIGDQLNDTNINL
jgi:hypothetical protein